MTIKHISCIKTFWRRHNPKILTSSRKEEVKTILDTNKESAVVKRYQRIAEHVITEPSVSGNVKKVGEKTESVPEFKVNSNFKRHFEVGKAEIAFISTMKLLTDIGSSVETISVLTNSNVSKDEFFRRNIIKKEHSIQLAGDWNFFFYLGFLSQTFTNHRSAGERGGHFFNSSLLLPPASQTLRH